MAAPSYTTVSTFSASQNDTTSSTSVVGYNAINNLLSQAIVTFLGELSAHEMFASENEDMARAKMDELWADFPKIPAGALYSNTIKHLWNTADQVVWKEKIKALAKDITMYVLHCIFIGI